MSELLEAVEAERERERARHGRTMEKIDGIEQRVLDLAADEQGTEDAEAPPAEEPAAAPEPDLTPPQSQQRQPAAEAAAERRDDLVELIRRQGPMTVPEVAATTGWRTATVSDYLRRLERDRRVAQTGSRVGPNGGRPSPVWEAVESPEPSAGMATNGQPALAPAPAVPADVIAPDDMDEEDELLDRDEDTLELDDEDLSPVVEIEDYRPPKQFTPSEQDERILEALAGEPMTSAQLADELGRQRRHVSASISRLSRAGRVDVAGAHDGTTLWRRRPLPHERPDVTIRHADRTGTVEGRILAEFVSGRRDEWLSLEQLAARLVLHPRIVAGGLESLIGDGQVEKSGHQYAAVIGAAA